MRRYSNLQYAAMYVKACALFEARVSHHQIAAELDVSRNTIRRWKRCFIRGEHPHITAPKAHGGKVRALKRRAQAYDMMERGATKREIAKATGYSLDHVKELRKRWRHAGGQPQNHDETNLADAPDLIHDIEQAILLDMEV